MLRTTYNVLDIKLTGTLQVCDGCALSKAKARAVRNKAYKRASQPGERIFVDMTGPFPEGLIDNRYWISVVENYSRYLWSFFTKTRYQLSKNMEYVFENITSHGTPVQYIRYNNVGEYQ